MNIADAIERLPPEAQSDYLILANSLLNSYLARRDMFLDAETQNPIEPAGIQECCFMIINDNIYSSIFNFAPKDKIQEVEMQLGITINQKIYCRDLSPVTRDALIANPADRLALTAFVGEAAFYLISALWHEMHSLPIQLID